MGTLTVYNSNDVSLKKTGAVGASYASVQGASTGDTPAEGDSIYEIGQDYVAGTTRYTVRRGGVIFDTSALPDDAVITSATLSFYGFASGQGVAMSLTVVNGADIDWGVYDPADYGDLLDDTTSFGSIASSSWVNESYNDITLNASGLAVISLTGNTVFALRSSRDISATTPSDGVTEYVQFYGGVQFPAKAVKLVITYGATRPGRHIWVEGTGVHYFTLTEVEKTITGTDTLANGTLDGQIWVEGTYLHYIDANLDERRTEGTLDGATGKLSGHIWVEGDNLRYIDANGDERYIAGV